MGKGNERRICWWSKEENGEDDDVWEREKMKDKLLDGRKKEEDAE